MQSLFLRIFLSLAAAFVLVSAAVFVVAAGSGTIPLTTPVLARAVLSSEIQASGDTALAAYQTGGAELLSRYFSKLRETSGTEGWLIDNQGRDLTGRNIPEFVKQFCTRNLETGTPAVALRRLRFTAAVQLDSGGHKYVLALIRDNPKGTQLKVLIPDIAPRYLAGLLAAFVFSFWLAQRIAAPVAQLRASMRQYAGGSAGKLLPPALLARSDELGDLSREFGQMQQRIEVLLQRQKELIADVSHELRSPLTRLAVAVEIMRDSPSREPELIDRLSQEISYLEALIQQLLRLAALEAQNSGQASEAVLLSEMLAVVIENAEFEAAAVEKKICCVRCPAELLVLGDEMLLISAIENIVRNAIRHTASHSSVDIEVAVPDGSPSAMIRVRDHGPGVPEEAIGKIFEPFYRVSAARNRHDGGVGLGLSIAQRSVALCGGDLSAHNHPQGGLVVELRLRRVTAAGK